MVNRWGITMSGALEWHELGDQYLLLAPRAFQVPIQGVWTMLRHHLSPLEALPNKATVT
jgi:hypothetical protein